MDSESYPTIRDLYPHFTEAELAVAEDNLEQYLMLALRIFERKERELAAAVHLTAQTGAIPCKASESGAS